MNTAVMISANNAIAMQASRARDRACQTLVAAYDSAGASIDQMKSYASCVQHLFPDPASGAEVIALKVAIIIVMASGVIGAVAFHDEWDGPIEGRVMGMLKGLVLSAATMLFGTLSWLGLRFVVT